MRHCAAMQWSVAGEEAMLDFGRRLASSLRGGDLVLLDGPLGAGKTTLVRGIAQGLGLDADEPVTSPTFSLVNDYETSPRLVHADLYRLESGREIDGLGLVDALDGSSVGCLEWAARFARDLPPADLAVVIARPDDSTRIVRIDALSDRGVAVLAALRASGGAGPAL